MENFGILVKNEASPWKIFILSYTFSTSLPNNRRVMASISLRWLFLIQRWFLAVKDILKRNISERNGIRAGKSDKHCDQ